MVCAASNTPAFRHAKSINNRWRGFLPFNYLHARFYAIITRVAYSDRHSGAKPDAKSHGAEGPMLEYSALRDELLQAHQMQWNIFALQLTVTAALFSFSLSSQSRTGFLLILPFVTYALGGRYLYEHYSMGKIASYITEELSPKINGGVRWDEWRYQSSPSYRTLFGWFAPLPMIFPATSVIAMMWVTPYIWLDGHASDYHRIVLGISWLFSLLFTALSMYKIKQSQDWHFDVRDFVAGINLRRRKGRRITADGPLLTLGNLNQSQPVEDATPAKVAGGEGQVPPPRQILAARLRSLRW